MSFGKINEILIKSTAKVKTKIPFSLYNIEQERRFLYDVRTGKGAAAGIAGTGRIGRIPEASGRTERGGKEKKSEKEAAAQAQNTCDGHIVFCSGAAYRGMLQNQLVYRAFGIWPGGQPAEAGGTAGGKSQSAAQRVPAGAAGIAGTE